MSETTGPGAATAPPPCNSAEDAEARAIAVAASVARIAAAQADHAMRHWTDPSPGKVRIGTPRHLRLFCNRLLQTHNPYKPAVIEWPALAPEALHRVAAVPIRDIAVQTEGRTSIRGQDLCPNRQRPAAAPRDRAAPGPAGTALCETGIP